MTRVGLGAFELAILLIVGVFIVRALAGNRRAASTLLTVLIAVLGAVFLAGVIFYVRSEMPRPAVQFSNSRGPRVELPGIVVEPGRVQIGSDSDSIRVEPGRVEIGSNSDPVRVDSPEASTEVEIAAAAPETNPPAAAQPPSDVPQPRRSETRRYAYEAPVVSGQRPTWLFVSIGVTALILIVLAGSRKCSRSGVALGFVVVLAGVAGMMFFGTSMRHDSLSTAMLADHAMAKVEQDAAARALATTDTAPKTAANDVPSATADSPLSEKPARPSWLEEPPKVDQGTSYRHVAGTWRVSFASAERDRTNLIRQALADHLAVQYGDDVSSVAFSTETLNKVFDDAYVEPADEHNALLDSENPLQPQISSDMHRLHVRIKINADANRTLTDLVSQQQERARLMTEQSLLKERFGHLGRIVGSVLACLATALGYFKLDTLTKGYYSGRLRFGAFAAILAILAALFFK